ncbi:conserved hypothetical protein [Ricinus communis]|uniref:Uncharacterized protein n=1 Tax=Ricinus communis TaxID=3988 RepID=B9S9L5_RICCO|nr:conserved hypothetical protein [Ricinus communis]
MIGAKKLLKLARKWQKLAAIRRKRITIPEGIGSVETNSGSTSAKGHFVVYSADQKRFSLPLAYLNNEIIQELLNIAAEAFGLPSKGPLTLAAVHCLSISNIKKQAIKYQFVASEESSSNL